MKFISVLAFAFLAINANTNQIQSKLADQKGSIEKVEKQNQQTAVQSQQKTQNNGDSGTEIDNQQANWIQIVDIPIEIPQKAITQKDTPKTTTPLKLEQNCGKLELQINPMIHQLKNNHNQLVLSFQKPDIPQKQLIKLQLKLRALQQIEIYLSQILNKEKEKPCQQRQTRLTEDNLVELSNFVQQNNSLMMQVGLIDIIQKDTQNKSNLRK